MHSKLYSHQPVEAIPVSKIVKLNYDIPFMVAIKQPNQHQWFQRKQN